VGWEREEKHERPKRFWRGEEKAREKNDRTGREGQSVMESVREERDSRQRERQRLISGQAPSSGQHGRADRQQQSESIDPPTLRSVWEAERRARAQRNETTTNERHGAARRPDERAFDRWGGESGRGPRSPVRIIRLMPPSKFPEKIPQKTPLQFRGRNFPERIWRRTFCPSGAGRKPPLDKDRHEEDRSGS
jgi:hypothetical protein